jgi:hypothetical protein
LAAVEGSWSGGRRGRRTRVEAAGALAAVSDGTDAFDRRFGRGG